MIVLETGPSTSMLRGLHLVFVIEGPGKSKEDMLSDKISHRMSENKLGIPHG